MKRFRSALFLIGTLAVGTASAEEVYVAVAANFVAPAKSIAAEFEKESGHKVIISPDATGKLYAQIKNGAPFEVFLSADQETPSKLAAEGNAIAGSQFTYAIGKLVLWSAKEKYVDAHAEVLRSAGFNHLAIANPKTAPYGKAAVEALTKLGLYEKIAPHFVQGENIAQTYQFIGSGNAELGFVALSQVIKEGQITSGSAWILDQALYSPIKQDAILLKKGLDKKTAEAFLLFLQSAKVKAAIRTFGYET